jgi:CheY-like chemotaxis protein
LEKRNGHGGDDKGPQASETPRSETPRTPPPPFDLAEFARDSESRLRASAETDAHSTAPPPPYHPASVHPMPVQDEPHGWLPPALQTEVLDCARRTALARAQLRIGNLSREEAARALGAELAGIEGAARGAHSETLQAIAGALREAIEELGSASDGVSLRRRRVIVIEEEEAVRDRITLAVEVHGYLARAAASAAAVTRLTSADSPDVILVGVSPAGAPQLCAMTREVLRAADAPVIAFARASGAKLEELAREAGASLYFSSDLSLDGLIAELGVIFMTTPSA